MYSTCKKCMNLEEPEMKCYGPNVCASQNSYVEALFPKMMIPGDKTFKRWYWRLDEVIKIGSCDGISAFIRRDTKEFAHLYALSPPYKDTARRKLSISHKVPTSK